MAYIWVFDYDHDGDVIMGSGRQEFVDESYLSGTDDDDDDDDGDVIMGSGRQEFVDESYLSGTDDDDDDDV